MVPFGQRLLYSDGVVVFGQKWLYSNKIGCIPAKVELLGQNGSIRAKKLVKKVLFRQR